MRGLHQRSTRASPAPLSNAGELFDQLPFTIVLYSEVAMSFVRYLMLLSLVIWIGGLIFFAFVLAPTVFAVLPTRQLAGNVVNRSLGIMHWMAISCGVVFAVTSMIDSRIVNGLAAPFAARNLLIRSEEGRVGKECR